MSSRKSKQNPAPQKSHENNENEAPNDPVILSPARRLPSDVLDEIFFHCLPTHHNPIMKYSESPLLLIRTCSSWRATALSSQIWSKIHISLPGDPSLSKSGAGIIKGNHSQKRLPEIRSRSTISMRCSTEMAFANRHMPFISFCHLSRLLSRRTKPERCLKDELTHEMFDLFLHLPIVRAMSICLCLRLFTTSGKTI